MSLSDLKARITSIPVDEFAAAAAATGDHIRGWWHCVAANGPLHVESGGGVASFADGLSRADAIVDQGFGVVILHPRGSVSDRTRAIVGLLCNADSTAITPRCGDDLRWMHDRMTIRDLQSEYRDRRADALDFVDDLVGSVGILLGLAARRTGVILIGPVAHASAVIAQRQSASAASWWQSGCTSPDPIVDIACQRLQCSPWVDFRTEVADEVYDDAVAGVLRSMRD